MSEEARSKVQLHKRYPKSSLLIYNGTTILHFLLGGVGIIYGYNLSSLSLAFGILYLVFAFGDMYILMPLKVCPACVYRRMEGGLCISGLNVISRKIVREAHRDEFPKRSIGLFCPNNLYVLSLALPIVALIPALFLFFSLLLLILFLTLLGLMLFRVFVIFPKIACVHCYAKYVCPQAEQMGVREL